MSQEGEVTTVEEIGGHGTGIVLCHDRRIEVVGVHLCILRYLPGSEVVRVSLSPGILASVTGDLRSGIHLDSHLALATLLLGTATTLLLGTATGLTTDLGFTADGFTAFLGRAANLLLATGLDTTVTVQDRSDLAGRWATLSLLGLATRLAAGFDLHSLLSAARTTLRLETGLLVLVLQVR